MKLELGKRYVRRDGEITDPMKTTKGNSKFMCTYPFYDPVTQEAYTPNGHCLEDEREMPDDLVSEYVEPQAEVEQLRARVKELEGTLVRTSAERQKWYDRTTELVKENLALKAKLDALTRPQLVRQTWQNLFPEGVGRNIFKSRDATDITFTDLRLRIAVLRRDTFKRPDGSTYVEAVLEPIEKETDK